MNHVLDQPTTLSELREALVTQIRVIGALVLRETKTRFGDSKLGYAWAIFEPLVHVAVLSLFYYALNRVSPVGKSVELFFATGYFAFMFYDKTATRVTGAITANKALLHLPVVKNMDVILARAFLELLTGITVFALILVAFHMVGVEGALPINPLQLVGAALVMWCLGLGVGCINALLNMKFSAWDKLFRLVTRPLYLLSGILFMVERIPPPISTYLLYNPTLHGVEWMRAAFFEGYGVYSLDRGYLITWAVGMLVLGLAVERIMRRRISVAG
jgi:capsular polysaccharide transport system permease protein